MILFEIEVQVYVIFLLRDTRQHGAIGEVDSHLRRGSRDDLPQAAPSEGILVTRVFTFGFDIDPGSIFFLQVFDVDGLSP